MELSLIGIGSGDPDHLTIAAVKAINAADLILIPDKGADKADLAELRDAILAAHLVNPATRVVRFPMPERGMQGGYVAGVEAWHDAIAAQWQGAITAAGAPARVALLVWGDPSLYDSTLRIAARLTPAPRVTVIPGITSLQFLTAGFAIPLNPLAGPVMITTGRKLRDEGWPQGTTRIAVMLDGECSFTGLSGEFHIWWGAYVGMPEQVLIEGRLADVAAKIVARRAELRAAHGWLMDVYLVEQR